MYFAAKHAKTIPRRKIDAEAVAQALVDIYDLQLVACSGGKEHAVARGRWLPVPREKSESEPNNFFIAPLCPSSTIWAAWSLQTRRK
ncbi:hypothetical protein PoB_005123400 [Plakobranchus ocellatus]|uniref:Uncharacterized protein n=1 Tax=Plakobranchus ocellatus TaxID=259542 RepID=A0AAV4C0S8_9GAST|nr:hypothetical protein PoB_005123400 [Plakobranchus ocellatus]